MTPDELAALVKNLKGIAPTREARVGTNTPTSEAMLPRTQRKADILVLTALREEAAPVAELADFDLKAQPELVPGLHDCWFGEVGSSRIALCTSDEMGLSAAASTSVRCAAHLQRVQLTG